VSAGILAKPLEGLRGAQALARLHARRLQRRWRRVDRTTRHRIQLAAVFSWLPVSAAVAAIAAAPTALDLDSLQSRPIVETVIAPALAPQIAAIAERREFYLREARVQRGETLAALLLRLGIDDEAAEHYLRTDPAARLLVRAAPGRFFQASIDAQGRLGWLRVVSSDDATAQARVLTLARDELSQGGFSIGETLVDLERRVELRSGEVQASFFAAADAAELPDLIAQQVVDALESDIDFHRSLQRGDSFRVVYEALYAGGEYLRPGRLLAVQFVNDGKPFEAYWFDNGSRNGGYYALSGRNMKRTFLRSPLEYTRLSSGFSSSRTHPIFGFDAAHRGIDYSAPTGTKIRSVAGGVIEFAGWQRGYGNVVEVRHDAKYSTLYAHMNNFAPGMVKGARIAQGDLVGYVGSTGWATGPHLHYEVKIHGNQVNPLVAVLPAAEPLGDTQRDALAISAEPLRAQLALLERIRVASTSARR